MDKIVEQIEFFNFGQENSLGGEKIRIMTNFSRLKFALLMVGLLVKYIHLEAFAV